MTRRSMTVRDVIKTVLPEGTNEERRWDKVCQWPPDLFAVVATITERSGLYSHQIFTAYWSNEFTPTEKWFAEIREQGRGWGETGNPSFYVRSLWRDLISTYGNEPIEDSSPGALGWKKTVFDLLVIADEACAGIGFLPDSSDEEVGTIRYIVYKGYVAWTGYNGQLPAKLKTTEGVPLQLGIPRRVVGVP